MNLDMLQRINNEGESRCGGNGGLKGIEWAYNTTPYAGYKLTDNIFNKVTTIPPNISPQYFEGAQTGTRMQKLGDEAPKPFQFTSDVMITNPQSAIYVCNNGSEFNSVNYRFVP